MASRCPALQQSKLEREFDRQTQIIATRIATERCTQLLHAIFDGVLMHTELARDGGQIEVGENFI